APELMVELYESFKNNDYKKALELQRKVNALRRVLYGLGPSNIATIKAALELRGVRAGLPKKPLRPMKSNEVDVLKEKLKALNLYW
ncbi:MAG: dihydrodipicolinate synthase family protein, partial [Candidatus Bathyarchaeia archaeon]